MSYCPPELLVALWALRGYLWEKQGQVDQCFVDYLQALAVIDEAWGDPRKRGGRGHPFAALLAWKLGLISYCPFIWGPPAWVDGGGEAVNGLAAGKSPADMQ